MAQKWLTLVPQLNNNLDLNPESRSLRGAEEQFKDGAEMSSVHFTASSSSVSSERYQLSTVSCLWYKPSKSAWLHYRTLKWTELAITKFGDSHKLRSCVVKAQLGEMPPHHIRKPVWSVVLGNLNIDTSKDDIRFALEGLIPDETIFGKNSYAMTETEACSLVQRSLVKCGPLESFETSQGLNMSRMKALARVTNAADAKSAASDLSGKELTIAGRHSSTKLFMNLTTSAKFLILGPLYEIVKGEIQKTQPESESVRINAYPPDREGKPVVLRIVGQDLKAVSKAKTVFERLSSKDLSRATRFWIIMDYLAGIHTSSPLLASSISKL